MTGRYKKMKKGKSWVIILVAVICIGLLGWYSTAVITDTKQKQEATANGESTKDKDYQNIKLGLDLSGGVSITYHIKDKNPSDKDVNDTIAKLEERAESYTTEYSVYKSGDDRITVEIPGVDDPNKVLEDLGSPGSLYFIAQYDSDGNANYTQDTSVEGGYKLNYDIDTLKANGSVILDGNDVKDASAQYDQSSSTSTKEPVVSLKLKDKAIDTWADATKKAKDAGQSIGIYYDDQPPARGVRVKCCWRTARWNSAHKCSKGCNYRNYLNHDIHDCALWYTRCGCIYRTCTLLNAYSTVYLLV